MHLALECDVETIVAFDALTYAGNFENIANLVDGRRVKFLKGDICDAGVVGELFEAHAFDCVVHFAAESRVDRSILGPLPFLRTNVGGTCVLIEAARRTWQDKHERRFIHVSTDEVFGDLGPGDRRHSPRNRRIVHPVRILPQKRTPDHLVRAWQRTHEVFLRSSLIAAIIARALAIYRKTDSADDHKCDRKARASGIWRWLAGARLAACLRSLPRNNGDY